MMLWSSQGYLTKYNFGSQDDMIYIHEPEGQFTEVSELPHTGDLKLMFKYERVPPPQQQDVIQTGGKEEERRSNNANMVTCDVFRKVS